MNRREFLGNLIAGAAAIVGAGMVAPQAEASSRNVGGVAGSASGELSPVWAGSADVPNLYFLDKNYQILAKVTNHGAGYTTAKPITITAPLTFEAMAQDCAARGCPMTRQAGGWAYVVRHPVDNQFGGTTLCTDSIEKLDAWRRSLHEQADTLADARAEGYADGHIQATQRAQSRVAEGLTV